MLLKSVLQLDYWARPNATELLGFDGVKDAVSEIVHAKEFSEVFTEQRMCLLRDEGMLDEGYQE